MVKLLILAATGVLWVITSRAQCWLSADRYNLKLLAGYIAQAPYLGLDQQDYQLPYIKSFINNGSVLLAANDPMKAEARLNEIALQFFSDVAYGKLPEPPVKYNGPSYRPVYHHLADSLHTYLAGGRFSAFLEAVEPACPEYRAVKEKIAFFRKRMEDSSFRDAVISSFLLDTSNKPLLARLSQFGARPIKTKSQLQEELALVQRMFNLLPDGTMRAGVARALNVPFKDRVTELTRALNQIRWLYCARQEALAVVVNIPSAGVVLYEHGERALYSRVVVGRRSTRTPTLCSRIDEVVLYPYWTVPGKIATRELLPHIKRNVGYLAANQFEVLDRKGRIVDPTEVNWKALHPGNFPYVLRQGTGCDNSMGIIKINFYSPYTVFLHDTPWKSLFMMNQRYFSHGCIRVQEALGLARRLLQYSAPEMDTLISKGWQPGQKPVPMPLSGPAYVFVLYNTAWLDEQGEVRFYPDEYSMFH